MVWVGRDLKDHAVPTSYHRQGHRAWTFSWAFAVLVSFVFCPLPSQGYVHLKGHILESVWRLTRGHSHAHSVVTTPYFKSSGLWKAGNERDGSFGTPPSTGAGRDSYLPRGMSAG